MERIYKRTHTIQTFRSGPLGPYLQRFVENSTQHGYARESIHVQLRCLVRFGRWLKRRRIPLRNVGRTDIQRYLRHDGDVRQGDARTLRRFQQLLGEQGVIVMPDTPLKTQVEIVAENFADYLKHERGLAPRTIEYHRGFVARFLAFIWQCDAISDSSCAATARNWRTSFSPWRGRGPPISRPDWHLNGR